MQQFDVLQHLSDVRHLSEWFIQISFNPDTNYYYYPYLVDEQTEALKG